MVFSGSVPSTSPWTNSRPLKARCRSSSMTPKRLAIEDCVMNCAPHELAEGRLAVSSGLARLMLVDRRLHRGARLIAGAGVFGLGVVVAPLPQFVRIALEMR